MDEILRGRVQILLVLFFHGAEIHGFLDDFVVVGDFVPVDGLHKGPGGAVVLHVVEEVEQLVVVGAVAGLSGELVHVRGPAGEFYRGDGHWIYSTDARFPFFGWWVDDVAFAERADLGENSFFLFEEHPSGFEVADFGDHSTLHDGTAFVILDIAHPARLLEGDFLGKSLLLKIPDGVIVGVGEKMLDGGGGLDIILQVGHQMSPVALNLLV